MVIGSFCVTKDNKLTTLQPKSLRITGTQKGFIQCFEIYQSIKSEEDLEQVSYIFPTDNTLCIYGMKFQVGDETITAELRSNKAAKETFEEAKKIGRTAAIAEETSPGITSVKIGNVPKDKIVAVIFNCTFSSTLSNPTTILTKIPLQASEPDGSVTDLYDLPSLEIDLDINISQLQPISDVYTNCEYQYDKTDDCNGKLTVKSAVFTDENILIMTEFPSPIQSQMIQTDNSTAISVIPEFESATISSKEFVFLIDCSASMIGESLKKAKESLNIFISKLPTDSYFNIIRFGTKFDKLFESSQKVINSNIEKAKAFVEKMKANLGGTEMLNMLDELFKDEVKTGDQRQIFIITDGEVYERQKVIQKVEENNGFNRIFAIGLGHGADAGFLEEIASITNGKSDFVFNASELPSKVSEQFDLSLREAAVGTEIHVEGIDSFEAVPYPFPPLLPRVVTHFFVSTHSKIENVMIVGHLKDGNQVENVVSLSSKMDVGEGEKSPVFALFAQRQLKKMEKELKEDDENDEQTEKLVKLSLESGVMCKKTSYIAASEKSYVVPKREEAIEHMPEMDCDEEMRICSHRCSYAADTPMMMMMDMFSKLEEPMMDECKPEEVCSRMREECMMEEKCLMEAESSRKEECMMEERRMIEEECSRMREECMMEERRMMEEELMMEKKCCEAPMMSKSKKKKKCDHDSCESTLELSHLPTSSEKNDEEESFVLEKVKPEPDWKSEASAVDILRLQSRDGFWDLHSSFVEDRCGGKMPEIGIDLSESPIVKKRVVSTVFTIAYLLKFFKESPGKWKFAKEKGMKWLKRIEGSVNWEKIIEDAIPSITK